jgi:two-component system response regulator YesN
MQNLMQTVRSFKGDKDNVILHICDYIRQNYAERLSLELLSERFFLNPSYLSTLFCQKTGRTISAFIRGVRIEKAKQLLTSTNMGIEEIALAVGYADYRHFTHLFKSQLRQTPTYFRMTQKSGRTIAPAPLEGEHGA